MIKRNYENSFKICEQMYINLKLQNYLKNFILYI